MPIIIYYIMAKMHIYSKYLKYSFIFFFHDVRKQPLFGFNLAPAVLILLQVSTMASFYSQENYIPESFSTAANELCCFLRSKRFSARADSSQGVPARQGNQQAAGPRQGPGLSGEPASWGSLLWTSIWDHLPQETWGRM